MQRKSGGDSERRRVPPPFIKKRVASGRGAMEQPNVTHDGEAALTPVSWAAITVTGVATGLLFALKPLVTAATLGSGASGGVFTPFVATGATVGGFLGMVWLHFWRGSPVGALALIGAAAVIGATMQALLAGLVLVMELTHNSFDIIIPMMTATTIATIIGRQVVGYTIYSARLPRQDEKR